MRTSFCIACPKTRHTLLTLKNYICDRHCKISFFLESIYTWVRHMVWLAIVGGLGWRHLSMIGATCRWLVFGSIWSQLVFWQHVQVWTSSIKYCNFYPRYMKKYIRQKIYMYTHITLMPVVFFLLLGISNITLLLIMRKKYDWVTFLFCQYLIFFKHRGFSCVMCLQQYF